MSHNCNDYNQNNNDQTAVEVEDWDIILNNFTSEYGGISNFMQISKSRGFLKHGERAIINHIVSHPEAEARVRQFEAEITAEMQNINNPTLVVPGIPRYVPKEQRKRERYTADNYDFSAYLQHEKRNTIILISLFLTALIEIGCCISLYVKAAKTCLSKTQ